MQLLLKDNLPFIPITVAYKGKTVDIPNVLIDTGSATTILEADFANQIQIVPSPEDILYTIRGVGGSEVVYTRQIDFLKIGQYSIHDFVVEIGNMGYGFGINGILGMDFLFKAGAIIDLQKLRIDFLQ